MTAVAGDVLSKLQMIGSELVARIGVSHGWQTLSVKAECFFPWKSDMWWLPQLVPVLTSLEAALGSCMCIDMYSMSASPVYCCIVTNVTPPPKKNQTNKNLTSFTCLKLGCRPILILDGTGWNNLDGDSRQLACPGQELENTNGYSRLRLHDWIPVWPGLHHPGTSDIILSRGH